MPKLNKVLAVYDRDGNRQAIPLYSSLSDVNNLGRHIKVAGIGDAYYPLTENLSHPNASKKTVVIGTKTYRALLTLENTDTGIKLMGSYTKNAIVEMISNMKGSPLANKEIESFTFSPSMHDCSIGSYNMNPFNLNNYITMGQYDGISDTDNWHFAALMYCGDMITNPLIDKPVPFTYTESQTNDDLGCILSVGEKSFKNSLKNNNNKFRHLDVSIKRHEPLVKNGKRLDGYSVIMSLVDDSNAVVYTKTLTLMYSDMMEKSKFEELFPDISRKPDTAFAKLNPEDRIVTKIIVGNEVPHIICFKLDTNYTNPSLYFNLIRIDGNLQYNIRSISNKVEVKPFSNTPRLIGEATRDRNNNPTFRILFSNLLLTKREVSVDTKREIGNNNTCFIISDRISEEDEMTLQNYYLFNRMAIINNPQYEGSKYCRVGIIKKGNGYNIPEAMDNDQFSYPKMYPLRLKDF